MRVKKTQRETTHAFWKWSHRSFPFFLSSISRRTTSLPLHRGLMRSRWYIWNEVLTGYVRIPKITCNNPISKTNMHHPWRMLDRKGHLTQIIQCRLLHFLFHKTPGMSKPQKKSKKKNVLLQDGCCRVPNTLRRRNWTSKLAILVQALIRILNLNR